MSTTDGTSGIVHTVHVAEETPDGELGDFTRYENVVDAMNLPDGSVKFHTEDGLKRYDRGRIVRTTVKGLEEAYRYRCESCEDNESDLISRLDRGDQLMMRCPVCKTETNHERMKVDDL